MSHTRGKQLGFFASITMLVGTVVGIGVFFKSHGILRANDWNGTGTFLAWLLGGILSLAAAVSFAEIGTMKNNKTAGLAAWAEKVGGQKFGYFVRFNYSFFYFGILIAVLGVFASEMLIKMIATFNTSFNFADFSVGFHVLLGLALSSGLLALNYLSLKTSGVIQIASTILKWIPLLVVVFAGLILANTNNKPMTLGGMALGENAFTNGHAFNFTGMLSALPAVLFAFDAFLNVGSMSNRMKKPKKFPLVIVIGMIAVLALYLMIALSAILHGTGMVDGTAMGLDALGIFGQVFTGETSVAMAKFTMVFMVISTFGVVNGFSAATIAVNTQAVDTNTIFGFKTIKEKIGVDKSVLILSYGLLLFWTAVIGIPAAVLNSDSIIDGVSNFPTLFFFGIYGTVIFLYTVKRNKFETKKMNKILFNVMAYTAIIGILFAVSYQVLYGFTISALQDPTATTHWGLFAGDAGGNTVKFPSKANQDFGVSMTKMQALLVFGSMFAMFFAMPKLNKSLALEVEKNNVIVDTFKS